MTGRNLSIALLVLTVIMMLPLGAHAQGGATGAISGVVVDASGAPVSGAQVEVAAAGNSTAMRTVVADSTGNFTVPSLPVGPYDVVVKASGYAVSKYNSVMVRVTETTRL